MKKTCILILFGLSSIIVHAQSFGVRGGLNLTNPLNKTNNYTFDTRTSTGYQFGITLETPISEVVYFDMAFLYTAKIYKYTIIYEFTSSNTYLEIPLNVEYKEEFGDINVFVEAGPYLAYGLSAKIKTGDTKENQEFGSDPGEIKRMDIGLNFGGGVEIDKLRLGINYGLGLVNLTNQDNYTYKMRNFAIYAAYKIN